VSNKQRFLTGSTMRHVLVMTLTGSLGLIFMFLVDVATLFWVSRLEDERLMAALGFAWTIQFFTISVGIGFIIATTAQVSRSIGQGNLEQARKQATSAIIFAVGIQMVLAAFVVFYRFEILSMAGANGETLQDAAHFLTISIPSLPVFVIGMVGSAVLRAVGDALGSMVVTLVAGLIAMVVDPLLIFGFGLGLEGAAWGVAISRGGSALLSAWLVVRVHKMTARVSLVEVARMFKPYLLIASPAIMTQLSTPFGNYLLTKVIANHGDAAVAGWAVISRVAVLAFGGIFSLSGAIGGIIGQNFGAGQMNRVRQTFRDALLFCLVYTLGAWTLLAIFHNPIARLFNLGPEATQVLGAFTLIGAGGYVFTGALFVSNAAFNNLGRPLYSTACNWFRDGLLIYPCAATLGAIWGASGVIYGQAVAAAISGTFAVIWGWSFVNKLARPIPYSPAKA
jgi:putative MATE family efflux protein